MLRVRELVKVYPGPVAALQGVDLDLPNGMFGLLGPNGAGKTTFMRILSGLLEPTSGSVTLDDHDVLSKIPSISWSRLGYLPQDFGFYPHLTGEAMLAYLLKLKGVTAPGGMKKLCLALLDRVNLGFAAKRKVKTYSGGMKLSAAWDSAQAIAGDPRASSSMSPRRALDPEERLRFYYLARRVGREAARHHVHASSWRMSQDPSAASPGRQSGTAGS